jgi:uncharacterized membrane protein
MIIMEKEKEKQKEEQKEKEPKKKEMPLTIFLFLLITAIVKDLIEISLAIIALLVPVLAPIILSLSWVISLPFTLFIFAITLISGIRAEWLFIGQMLDLLPLVTFLPIATLTVILCYILQKLPAPLKKTVEKASKLTSLKPLETKI